MCNITYNRNVIIMLLTYLPIFRAGSVSVDKGIVRISCLVFRDMKDIEMREYIYRTRTCIISSYKQLLVENYNESIM